MSLIRESIKKHLLLEEIITNLKSNITIDFQISKHDTGVHFNKRQGRHDEYIYREKIENLIEDAIDEIATQIVLHNIRHMRRFVISRDGGDYLNVVIEPSITGKGSWNLAVVTIMMEPNFDVKPGQLRFFVSADEDEDYD